MKRFVLFSLVLGLASSASAQMGMGTMGDGPKRAAQAGDLVPTGALVTPSGVTSVAFSPDSTLLAGGSIGKVHLWNVTTGEQLPALSGFVSVGTSLAFSPDGKALAVGSIYGDSAVRVFDVAASKVIHTLDHGASISAISYSKDGNLLATAGIDKSIRVWDTATGESTKTLSGLVYPVVALQWVGNELQSVGGGLLQRTEQLMSGAATIESWLWSAQGEYSRWNAAGVQIQHTPLPDAIPAAHFSPDGLSLAVICGSAQVTDKGNEPTQTQWSGTRIEVWSISGNGIERSAEITGANILTPTAGILPSIAWSTSGTQLVAATAQASYYWTRDGQQWRKGGLKTNNGNDGRKPAIGMPRVVAYSPDGKYLAGGVNNPKPRDGHGIQVWTVTP